MRTDAPFFGHGTALTGAPHTPDTRAGCLETHMYLISALASMVGEPTQPPDRDRAA
ncbi:hypothetical protein [Streptomyces mirabilis]|uniref:hypothetical protein n=1 Tax=Streptomyces mirabilis TaxID=68239 RepID=UPI0033BD7809